MENKTVISGFLRLMGEGDALAVGDDFIAESLEFINGKNVSVRYWISDDQITLDQAIEVHQITSMGSTAECEYNVVYSDVTGYLWTDEELKVGGHDLIRELSNYLGKYLILEVIVHEDVK